MINHALEIASAAAVLIVVLLIWLLRERFKLKKELQLLKENVSRNNQDIVDFNFYSHYGSMNAWLIMGRF